MTNNIKLHTESDFKYMRKAGGLAADCLDYITEYVKPGVSTSELDELCHKFQVSKGAIPAPLNYKGFPKSSCTSTNHVVCHGIPSDKILNEGDILNVDVTAYKDGWHGDTSRMFEVGKISVKAKRLIKTTYDSMMKGIKILKIKVFYLE